MKKRSKQLYQDNPGKVKERSKQQYQDDPEKVKKSANITKSWPHPSEVDDHTAVRHIYAFLSK